MIQGGSTPPFQALAQALRQPFKSPQHPNATTSATAAFTTIVSSTTSWYVNSGIIRSHLKLILSLRISFESKAPNGPDHLTGLLVLMVQKTNSSLFFGLVRVSGRTDMDLSKHLDGRSGLLV